VTTRTLTWVATDSCGNSNSCSQVIDWTACPKLCVDKEIAGFLGTNSQGSEICDAFSHFAIGVQGDTQDPAFCYQITVSNCGPVTVTNITVIDDKYGDITTNFFGNSPATLPPGGIASFMFKAELSGAAPPDQIAMVTNTAVASGQSALCGSATSAQDSAVAEILPAAISGEQFYTIDGGALTNCIYLTDLLPHVVVSYITLQNMGSADLLDIFITNNGSNPCPIDAGPFTLPAGTNLTIPLCTNTSYTCTNSPSTVVITVGEVAYGTGTNVAIRDLSGTLIIVRGEASGCSTCVLPNAARVTGGGRQDASLLYPAGSRYATHGGQVGAPLGQANCVVTVKNQAGNPCIHGRWTHVRHGVPGTEGNFHARLYDTLASTCVDTNLDAGGSYGPGTVVNAVCNPDDPAAGPAPRRAPANKLAFTGVGDWSDGQGGRAPQSVLFRVDVEDRGEPGGSHAHGGLAPPDRYRIRIWVLSDTELAQLHSGGGQDPYLLSFRNAISACAGISVRDGADVANGTAVFGVRAPDIDDGGELQRGNVQIHPEIQNCSSTSSKLLLLE